MQKLIIFYVVILLTLSTTKIVNANNRGKFVGGKSQVKDVKTNKEIQDLGQFSIQEHNRNLHLRDGIGGGGGGEDGPLRFIEVVEAQRQVVNGIKYYLKVEAMQNTSGLSRTFYASLLVKPWIESKQLLNFGPSLL